MNKSYIEWIDYYENATKEDVIQDMMLDINSIKEKDKEIERLSKEVTIYDEILCERNNKVHSLYNIINELEKWLEEFANLEPKYEYEIAYCNAYKCCLDKLKELKEDKNE